VHSPPTGSAPSKVARWISTFTVITRVSLLEYGVRSRLTVAVAARLGKKGIHGMNIFTKNMFLAEDR
jgi:hypothetical protein